MDIDMTEVLSFTVKNDASDLHISAGLPPMVRVDGELRRIKVPAFDEKTAMNLLYDIMNDKQRQMFEEKYEVDFSFEIKNLSRFRANVFNHDRGLGGAFRTIPTSVKTLDDLKLPGGFRISACWQIEAS